MAPATMVGARPRVCHIDQLSSVHPEFLSRRTRAAMEVDVTRYEQMLQRDMTRIRSKVREMGQLTERALDAALKALASRNPQLAGAVILRDHRVDTLEREIDRLCLEF